MSRLSNYMGTLDVTSSREERACWLLACPLDVLLSCEIAIRKRLANARFQEGLDYLDAELTDLRRERGADGGKNSNMLVGVARGRMERIALGLPARQLQGGWAYE